MLPRSHARGATLGRHAEKPQISRESPPPVHAGEAAWRRRCTFRPDDEPHATATSTFAGTGPVPARAEARRGRRGPPALRFSVALYVALPATVAVAAAVSSGAALGGFADYLPTALLDASFSFLRMLAAYALSLAFALAYGYYAATHRGGERVMIPVLDILQSVPILGFFPFAVAVLAAATPGSFLGPNFASVFLIFTSMAWNMVFGVYESLKTLPADLKEAADTFGLRGWLLFRRVLFPATVNRLVYNSVLSWTAGWFFLVEAEIFASSRLQGIGSYLFFAAKYGNGGAFVAGVAVLVAIIALLDVLVWRPLGRWAERFRYDQAPAGESGLITTQRDATGRFRRATLFVTRGVRTGFTRLSTPLVQLAAITVRPGKPTSPRRRSIVYYLSLGVILVLVWLLLIAIFIAVFHVFTSPIAGPVRADIDQVPLAMLASIGRVVAAYAVCLAIALPLAIAVARSRRATRAGLPVIEIVASFPATALFPVIIFGLVPYLTANGAAILMLLTGMEWYLFFNLLSGVRSLPPDLVEAAHSYGVKGRRFYRRVLLPGIFPALVTGSITAFGGGWNTLIVAEYLSLGNGETFSLLGIGQLIDVGSQFWESGSGAALLVTALLTLVVTVIAINELIWKPLYRRAVAKYRYD